MARYPPYRPARQLEIMAQEAQCLPSHEPLSENTLSSDGKDPSPPSVSMKSGVCFRFLVNKACQYGDSCKQTHFTVEQFLEAQAPVFVSDEGASREVPSSVEAKDAIKARVSGELYKTRLCRQYQTGECKRGRSCHFVHITGPDATKINARANTNKSCPYERHLGTCLQRICFFKHAHRESTPMCAFGDYHKDKKVDHVVARGRHGQKDCRLVEPAGKRSSGAMDLIDLESVDG